MYKKFKRAEQKISHIKLWGYAENNDPQSMETPPPNGPTFTDPHTEKIIKMTIRDLTYPLFCFGFCHCFLLHCGDERRTFVLRKRTIT